MFAHTFHPLHFSDLSSPCELTIVRPQRPNKEIPRAENLCGTSYIPNTPPHKKSDEFINFHFCITLRLSNTDHGTV